MVELGDRYCLIRLHLADKVGLEDCSIGLLSGVYHLSWYVFYRRLAARFCARSKTLFCSSTYVWSVEDLEVAGCIDLLFRSVLRGFEYEVSMLPGEDVSSVS